jgi:hypothetical protein
VSKLLVAILAGNAKIGNINSGLVKSLIWRRDYHAEK